MPAVGVGAAVEVAALQRAAADTGQAVDLRLTGGGQSRGAVTVAQTAAVVASGEAAQPHGAVADVLGEQGAQRVGGLDGAVVDTGQSAGIDRGVVGRDNDGGAVGLAGEDAQRAVAGRAAGEVAAHQPADIECAVIVGYQAVVAAAGGAHEAVAGGGAVGDNAVVPPGQHACIGADGAAVQLTVHPHGLTAAGHQHGIAYLAAAGYGGEHTDAAAAVGHEGHAGNRMAVAVVLGREAVGTVDGRLLPDTGVGRVAGPVIGGIVDVPLLQIGAGAGTGGVVGVVQAQSVEMACGAEIDGIGRTGAGGDALGEVGVEVVGAAAHCHLLPEGGMGAGGGRHGGGERHREQIIGLTVVVGGVPRAGGGQGDAGRTAGDGKAPACGRLLGQGHGVAVAHDGLCLGQTVHIAAEEAVGAVAVYLVVHQRVGLELSLPVTVVLQRCQPGVGVGAQALIQQVVGMAVAAGWRGKHAVQPVDVGAECIAAQLVVGAAVGALQRRVAVGQVAPQIEYVVDGRGGASGQPHGGGIDVLCVAVEGAGAVRGLGAVQRAVDQTGSAGPGSLIAHGVAIGQGGISPLSRAAHQSAGDGRGEVAVGVGAADGDMSACIAHQSAGIGAAADGGGGEAAADGELLTGHTHQTACLPAGDAGGHTGGVLGGHTGEIAPPCVEVHGAVADGDGPAGAANERACGTGGGSGLDAGEGHMVDASGEAGEQSHVRCAGRGHGEPIDGGLHGSAVL